MLFMFFIFMVVLLQSKEEYFLFELLVDELIVREFCFFLLVYLIVRERNFVFFVVNRLGDFEKQVEIFYLK